MKPSQEYSARREALLAVIGLWKDRTDLPETEDYIRELRSGDRLRGVMNDDPSPDEPAYLVPSE
jgi:hypothetical protein